MVSRSVLAEGGGSGEEIMVSLQKRAFRAREITSGNHSRCVGLQTAKLCSQLAGSSKDCVLTTLLKQRINDDGATFKDEDDLKDTMSNVYLGTCYLKSMACLLSPRTSRNRNGKKIKSVDLS